jgi:homeobox-leucine zipper protein
MERHENTLLRQDNDKLHAENMSLREAMRNPICNRCGGPAMLGEVSLEEQHLRMENARLKDELTRVCTLAGKLLGKPVSSMSPPLPLPMPNSSLDLAVGTNAFSTPLPALHDFSNNVSSPLGTVITPARGPSAMAGMDKSLERSVLLELALAAMDELVKMAQMEEPLWVPCAHGAGPKETLNYEEYLRTFNRCIGVKPVGFMSEATRETGVVIINSMALVETLMDSVRFFLLAHYMLLCSLYMGVGAQLIMHSITFHAK